MRDAAIPLERKRTAAAAARKELGVRVKRSLETRGIFKARKEITMLNWAISFLIIAIVAAILGFGGIAATSVEMARILFVIFIVLFVVSLFVGLIVGRRPKI